ncbi:MAG: fibronectin type III domain-containing protein [Candidatus Eisenbacteria bacterium]|uniref:Fibronectin type III domain-containing protein n=1 Tax=Eiseniibacteriota bacterium TaxID=2212470 RepID=A0A948S1G3_UNCEI|nr:fibronectin type III domain-containing protein [Candidatus Eisenbacteria bacterium]MBU1948389.1 fibronectin type III domain-containing protein [Candidatus Eisenbacteria bacterium]MBU2692089.1 fibronectin type III domain-containing protein [Candidatus Eisenbacteria bacterium]
MNLHKWLIASITLIFILLGLGCNDDDKPSGPGDAIAPSAVNDLAASDATENSIQLTWTATGDDNTSGTASDYDIRFATADITVANWSNATKAAGEPNPAAAGTPQTFTVTNLRGGTEYFFALKVADEEPNWSDLSNTAVDTTLPSSLMLVASSGGKYAIIDPVTGEDSVIVEPNGTYDGNGDYWAFGYGCRRVYFMAKPAGSGTKAIFGCDAFDGVNVERLTDAAQMNVEHLDGSPAEEKIVFQAWGGAESNYPGRNIFVINESGSGLTQLTHSGEAMEEPDGTDVTIDGGYMPIWSPDGTKIAFFARSLTRSKALHYDWVVMDADGNNKEVVNVYNGFSDIRRGGWSQDGEFLFINQLEGADWSIYALHIDSRIETEITAALGLSPAAPYWIAPSPLDDEIAFDRFMASATSLYKADYTVTGTSVSVSNSREVAHSNQYGVLSYDEPDWAPFYPEN